MQNKIYKDEIDKAIVKNNETINRIQQLSTMLFKSDSLIVSAIGKNDYSIKEAKQISVKTNKTDEAIRFLEFAKTNNWTQQGFLEAIEYYQSSNDFHNNIDFNCRATFLSYSSPSGTHLIGIIMALSEILLTIPLT